MNLKKLHNFKEILLVKRSQIVDLSMRCKQRLMTVYREVRIWVKHTFSINGKMARHGGLFLSFGLLLLTVRHTREVSLDPIPTLPVDFSIVLRIVFIVLALILAILILWIWRKYELANRLKRWLKPVAYFFVSLFAFALLAVVCWLILPILAMPALFFIVLGLAAFLISLAFMVAVLCKGLAKILTKLVERRLSPIYWMVFWLVYSVGYIKGLASIPEDTWAFVFNSALWIGLLGFFIIGLVYLRASWRSRKQTAQTK